MLNVAVIGSRKWQDKNLVFSFLDFHENKIKTITSGNAVSGPDKMGVKWGRKNNKEIVEFNPDKKRKHPFHYRNRLIAENCDIVIAFWDGRSSGTKYTIDYATRLGKKVIIVKPGQNINQIETF